MALDQCSTPGTLGRATNPPKGPLCHSNFCEEDNKKRLDVIVGIMT